MSESDLNDRASDNLGQLEEVFNKMFSKHIRRQEALQQEIETLKDQI